MSSMKLCLRSVRRVVFSHPSMKQDSIMIHNASPRVVTVRLLTHYEGVWTAATELLEGSNRQMRELPTGWLIGPHRPPERIKKSNIRLNVHISLSLYIDIYIYIYIIYIYDT